jgi:hypothetical protein
MPDISKLEKKYQRIARDYLRFLPKSPAKKIGLYKFFQKKRIKEFSNLINNPDIKNIIEFFYKYHNELHASQDVYTLTFLLECIRQTEELDGNIIELGSYKCGTTIMLAKFLEQIKSKKKIFACDTFDGMPEDDEFVEETIAAGLFGDTSFDFVSKQIQRFGVQKNIELIKGKFQDVFDEKLKNEKFSLVFMDCDIYSSAKYSIEFSYPKLADKGFMIFHDYSIGKSRDSEWGETKAVDDFLKDKIETVVIDSIPFIQKGNEALEKIENIPKNEFSTYGKK